MPCALVVGRKKRIVSGHDRPRVNAAARLAESGLLDHASEQQHEIRGRNGNRTRSHRRQRRVHHADRLTPRPDARRRPGRRARKNSRACAPSRRTVRVERRTRPAHGGPDRHRPGGLCPRRAPRRKLGADRIVEIPERPATRRTRRSTSSRPAIAIAALRSRSSVSVSDA